MRTKEMMEKAGQVKQTAQEWSNRATTKAKDASAMANTYAHEHLWTTVAAVGIAACVVGFLLGRQSRTDQYQDMM